MDVAIRSEAIRLNANESGSPIQVRTMLLRIFAHEHGERFRAQHQAVGLHSASASAESAVEGIIRIAFRQAGGSFEEPTRESLTKVTNLLAERSLEWGSTPEAVLDFHSSVMRSIASLPDRAN